MRAPITEVIKEIADKVRKRDFPKNYICSDCGTNYGVNEGISDCLTMLLCPNCKSQNFRSKND